MTVVCYKKGVMASDSMISDGDLFFGSAQKVIKTPSGGLFGTAGRADVCHQALSWAASDFTEQEPFVLEPNGKKIDLDAIYIAPNGEMYFLSQRLIWVRIDADCMAIGCGQEFATGAMKAGATAEKAVKLAIGNVSGCGGALQLITF